MIDKIREILKDFPEVKAVYEAKPTHPDEVTEFFVEIDKPLKEVGQFLRKKYNLLYAINSLEEGYVEYNNVKDNGVIRQYPSMDVRVEYGQDILQDGDFITISSISFRPDEDLTITFVNNIKHIAIPNLQLVNMVD